MEYVCYNCGKKVSYNEIMRRVRCTYCGGKILFKRRPEIVKKVKAR